MVTVHITNEGIKILDATYSRNKLHVKYAERISIAEGIVEDSEILAPDLLEKAFRDLPQSAKKRLKKFKLIIGSHNYPANKWVVPIMPESKTLKYIEGEYRSKTSREERMVYDYMTLKVEGKTQTILALALSESYLDSYLNMFKKLKMEVESVDFAMATIIKAASEGINKRKENCILVSLKANYITTFLFIRGDYYYMTTKKSSHKRGTSDFYEDVNTAISALNQYSFAEIQGGTMDRIYLMGINNEERDAIDELSQFFTQSVNIATERITPENLGIKMSSKVAFDISQFIHNVGALIK